MVIMEQEMGPDKAPKKKTRREEKKERFGRPHFSRYEGVKK